MWSDVTLAASAAGMVPGQTKFLPTVTSQPVTAAGAMATRAGEFGTHGDSRLKMNARRQAKTAVFAPRSQSSLNCEWRVLGWLCRRLFFAGFFLQDETPAVELETDSERGNLPVVLLDFGCSDGISPVACPVYETFVRVNMRRLDQESGSRESQALRPRSHAFTGLPAATLPLMPQSTAVPAMRDFVEPSRSTILSRHTLSQQNKRVGHFRGVAPAGPFRDQIVTAASGLRRQGFGKK